MGEQVNFMGKNLWMLQMETNNYLYGTREHDLRDFWQMYNMCCGKTELENLLTKLKLKPLRKRIWFAMGL